MIAAVAVSAEEAVVGEPEASAVRPRTGSSLDGPIVRSEYTVGPHDVFSLTLWGEANITTSLSVMPEGDLVLPVGGPVHVAGLTIDEAAEIVAARIDEYYHDTEHTFVLATPRTLTIHVTGAVRVPGEYAVSAATRVSSVLGLAGGILEGGSERNVSIGGNGAVPRPVDLVSYWNLGDLSANPYAMSGSVVHVPFARRSAMILGAVNRPGRYEIVNGDLLLEMLELAGGLRPEANVTDIQIVRFDEGDPTSYTSFSVDLSGVEARADSQLVVLKDGDRVLVRSIERWHEDARIEITGEVLYPGIYSIEEGRDRLSDIVAEAGGLSPAADLPRAALLRRAAAPIEDGAQRQVELLEEFERDQMTYEEYAFLVSQRLELSDQVSVDFEAVLLRGLDSADVLLLDQDRIEIPRALAVVRVSGAVRRPGLVRFRPGALYSDYVQLAGGYTSDAQRNGLRIVKSQSGSRLRPSRRVRVEPGDIVWIPRKQDRDWWEIAKGFLGVVSQVATIAILIDGITN